MRTSAEIDNFLSSRWGIISTLPDDAYSLPSRHWVEWDFSRALFSVLSQLGFSYTEEKSDCDDFARLSAAYAALLHSKEGNKTGLAFGEFWYTRRDGGGHAINCYIVSDGGELALRFFEPQTQSELALTDEEILSCVFCRF